MGQALHNLDVWVVLILQEFVLLFYEGGCVLRKKYLMVIVLALVLSVSAAGFASAAGFSDVPDNYWAKAQIDKWVDQGLTGGYQDGTYKPGQQISRAEFVALVNRSFSIQGSGNAAGFTDVKSTAWYYGEVDKANYMAGYQDGTFGPNKSITRQEAAAIIARLMSLSVPEQDVLSGFSDGDKIAPWAKAAVGAVVQNKIMSGYTDGSYKPGSPITRAEAVVTLDRAVGGTSTTTGSVVYETAGTYGPEQGVEVVAGSVTINVPGVTLQNTTISGNLILGAGIGDGDANLVNVTVRGKTIVRGGGENSIVFTDCVIGGLVVEIDEATKTVRIVAAGSTTVENAELRGNTILEGSYNEVAIPAGYTVQLVGDFGNVTITEPATVTVDGSVESLSVSVEAEGTLVTMNEESSIGTLTLDGEADVKGEGTIESAVINADGCLIEQDPEEVEIADDISATVDGDRIGDVPAGGGGGGGGVTPSDSTPAVLQSVTVTKTDPLGSSLAVTGSGSNWTAAQVNTCAGCPVGKVTFTFNETVQRDVEGDIELYINDSDQQAGSAIKTVLMGLFGGGDTKVIEYTIGTSYADLHWAMDFAAGEEVTSLKFVVKDLAGNKTDIILNITRLPG
ncbi:MAG: hypothetical protein VR67_18795 [Peptococcaceae bacterium BRH_c8a]|nr:MAG: hypothetical protein VR67_18795 [Peptococcaceae bacterium BRH_c8a]